MARGGTKVAAKQIRKVKYEAASALGLGLWRKTGLVGITAGTDLVIPGIVNTFISLSRHRTLVSIIGCFRIFLGSW